MFAFSHQRPCIETVGLWDGIIGLHLSVFCILHTERHQGLLSRYVIFVFLYRDTDRKCRERRAGRDMQQESPAGIEPWTLLLHLNYSTRRLFLVEKRNIAAKTKYLPREILDSRSSGRTEIQSQMNDNVTQCLLDVSTEHDCLQLIIIRR